MRRYIIAAPAAAVGSARAGPPAAMMCYAPNRAASPRRVSLDAGAASDKGSRGNGPVE